MKIYNKIICNLCGIDLNNKEIKYLKIDDNKHICLNCLNNKLYKNDIRYNNKNKIIKFKYC